MLLTLIQFQEKNGALTSRPLLAFIPGVSTGDVLQIGLERYEVVLVERRDETYVNAGIFVRKSKSKLPPVN